ncbi:hypothetical protein GCM10009795_026810 [Nocardioides hankookensis]
MTIPPAWAMAVATAPTIPWSGAVCRRMVIEYDEVVAAMLRPSSRPSVTGKSAPPIPVITPRASCDGRHIFALLN